MSRRVWKHRVLDMRLKEIESAISSQLWVQETANPQSTYPHSPSIRGFF